MYILYQMLCIEILRQESQIRMLYVRFPLPHKGLFQSSHESIKKIIAPKKQF